MWHLIGHTRLHISIFIYRKSLQSEDPGRKLIHGGRMRAAPIPIKRSRNLAAHGAFFRGRRDVLWENSQANTHTHLHAMLNAILASRIDPRAANERLSMQSRARVRKTAHAAIIHPRLSVCVCENFSLYLWCEFYAMVCRGKFLVYTTVCVSLSFFLFFCTRELPRCAVFSCLLLRRSAMWSRPIEKNTAAVWLRNGRRSVVARRWGRKSLLSGITYSDVSFFFLLFLWWFWRAILYVMYYILEYSVNIPQTLHKR